MHVKKRGHAVRCLTAAVSFVIASSVGFTAHATTTSVSQVIVQSNAYLVSSPHTGMQKIALEPVGSRLTVELGGNSYWYHVKDAVGRDGYVTTNPKWVAPVSKSHLPSAQLPPGVTTDPNLQPIAPSSATTMQKAQAILQVAMSKFGTPYVWGHNEDNGQYGFDCSNFVSYVYHHALGYVLSGASQNQNQFVGWTIPLTELQPGDLLIFNNGGHVGIYAGNNQVIQEGGGLGQVGYLKFAPGSYWYTHLTSVRRMF